MKEKGGVSNNKGGTAMLIKMDKLEIDELGRIKIKDRTLARAVNRLKSKRAMSSASSTYSSIDSTCPPDVSGNKCGGHPEIGCGCPKDSLCTCVAQCGCSLSLCKCA